MADGSSGKLADTTFNTSPDDKLAVVDVYENESSGIENSFQDEYHKSGDDTDLFDSIGKESGDSFDFAKDLKGNGGDFNDILDGLKSGNLDSLTSLTGGGLNGFKQISDAINQVTKSLTSGIGQSLSSLGSLSGLGNSLTGGLNINSLLDKLVSNIPLSREIKNAINSIGKIASNKSSLESSMGRASILLGGDRSSQNTIMNGTRNAAREVEKSKPYDTPPSPEQTKLMVNNIKQINTTIGSAVSDLPKATQEALVRGFNAQEMSKGVLVSNSTGVSKFNSEASKTVIEPLEKIIGSFNPEEKEKAVVQDTRAVSVLISGVTNIASKAGFKNTFSKLTKNIQNKEVIMTAAKPLLVRAIDEGDLDTVVDLSNASIHKELKTIAPDLVEKVCYKTLRPLGMSQQSFANYYKNIKIAFQRIDPDWCFYKVNKDKTLINGYCIGFNSFMCDIIEAKLNELNNTKLKGEAGQDVSAVKLNGTAIVHCETEVYSSAFSEGLEQAIDSMNKESFQKFAADGTKIIALPPEKETTEPTVPTVPLVLDYSSEKFLLLASVFIDNSVDSEIERHFPFLNIRFKTRKLLNV